MTRFARTPSRCSPIGETLPPRDERVDREVTNARQHQRRARSRQQHDELVPVRHEEAVLQVHEQHRAQHVEHESQRDEPRQQPEDQRDSAEELEQRDERAYDARHWDAHLGEAAGDSLETENEELLSTVRDEDDAGDDSENGQGNARLAAGSGLEDRHGGSLRRNCVVVLQELVSDSRVL